MDNLSRLGLWNRRGLLARLLLSGEGGHIELRRFLALAQRNELRRFERELQEWLEAVQEEIRALDVDDVDDIDEDTDGAGGLYSTVGNWEPLRDPSPRSRRSSTSPSRRRTR